MSCDVHLELDKPFTIEVVCYNCGEPVKPDPRTGFIQGHEGCWREWGGKNAIPADIEISNEI